MDDSDDAVVNNVVTDTIVAYMYPAARLALAGVAVWYSSGASA